MIKKLSVYTLFIVTTLINRSCFTIKYDMKGAQIDPEIKTISVQYFDNRAQRIQPQLSQNFTDALRDYMERNTNLRMINGFGDVDFSGEIVGYDITPTSISANDVAAQTRFTIRIKVTFTNSVNPDDSYEETFSRYRDFDSTQSFSSVESELTEEIIEELVEEIYNRAFVNW